MRQQTCYRWVEYVFIGTIPHFTLISSSFSDLCCGLVCVLAKHIIQSHRVTVHCTMMKHTHHSLPLLYSSIQRTSMHTLSRAQTIGLTVSQQERCQQGGER